MAFPTHPQLRSSVFIPLDTPDTYVATHGEAKTYTTFTNEPGIFNLNLRLTAAQLEEWEDHFDANQLVADLFTWQMDSTAHNCYWEQPPISQRLAVDLFDVVIVLRKAT